MTPDLTPILTGAALYTAVSLIVIWRQAVCLRRRWREVADFQVEVLRLKGVLAGNRWLSESDGKTIARLVAERDELAARLDAANAVLDVAYVRGDRGHFRRYRAQKVAA